MPCDVSSCLYLTYHYHEAYIKKACCDCTQCIFSRGSMLLSEWMASRPDHAKSKPVRLIMLDGTFPAASRLAKYLMRCCDLRGIQPSPIVKLDLENDCCKSALAGMMYQPGRDKICTYQATVMAMQQVQYSTTSATAITW